MKTFPLSPSFSSRRSFLQKAGLTGLALPFAADVLAGSRRAFPTLKTRTSTGTTAGAATPKLAVFSKALQWTEPAQMAELVAEAGFHGVDLTVRPGGHVEPEKVKDELPKIAEVLRAAGLEIVMITTAIGSAGEPHTRDILSTAGQLGIGYYRMNWLKYDPSVSIEDNLATCQEKLAGLAALNETYKIRAGYQNHAGVSFGSPIWDLALILRQLNSPWMGSQYDIRHAVVEGANSWTLGLDCIGPFINTIAVKDFYWGKNNNGKWEAVNVPLGQGMVDFDSYFQKLKALDKTFPVTVHMEYDLGGAEHGYREANITPEKMLEAMKQEVAFLNRFL